MTDIATERARAQANLEVAERAMTLMSGDAEKFRAAKAERAAAIEALERLEWAEKHQAELAAQKARQDKLKQIDDARGAAKQAHAKAAEIAAELDASVDRIAELLRALNEAAGLINRGIHFENWGIREGLAERVTIPAGAGVSEDLAIRLLTAARALVKLSPVTMSVADNRAMQRRL